MRFAISRIWNDQKHIDALRPVVPEGWHMRRRGRGYRFGRRAYHQSLPLDLSAYFTQYAEPPTPWRDRGPEWYRIEHAVFRGFTDTGKPIIRYQHQGETS